MKLALLLAQFLYSHKRLDLAGIGSFYLDPGFSIDNEVVAQQKSISPEAISFESNPSVKDSSDLITFISSQTGKMKALAEADLGSHLELAKQFLNIGKPFMLDGIGSLVKVRSGHFEFTAGAILAEKLKDFSEKDSHESSPEESFKNYEPFLKREKTRTGWAKPVLALLVIFGIGLAVLGGYMIYKKNNPATLTSQDETVGIREMPEPGPAHLTGTVAAPIQSESTVSNSMAAGNYKFVLEIARKKRAFDRFEKLRSYGWKVQMETNDSIQYKLFMMLPASASDTTRLLDSLSAQNGRKVILEN